MNKKRQQFIVIRFSMDCCLLLFVYERYGMNDSKEKNNMHADGGAVLSFYSMPVR